MSMSSPVFAIAHIHPFSLYIGATEQLKARWALIEQQLEQGRYPDSAIQAAWNTSGDCRFTFRTAQDIAQKPNVLGIHQFIDDLCEEALSGDAPWENSLHGLQTSP